MQSKQTTQREASMRWALGSMQPDLQLRAHSPQPLHLSVSMLTRITEALDTRPSTVPTGQMVLQ